MELRAAARRLRDIGKGRTITFSPKVFIPLTRLCRDVCRYCAFRQAPERVPSPYMAPEEVLEVALAGQRVGCREALFVLGERPEQRYSAARRWLSERHYDSSLEYLREVCALVLRETRLYPHSNAGILSRRELMDLKKVNVSMGLMLETSSPRLCEAGGPHEHAPSKRPETRLRTLATAGELKIPFTTGLLIGIGETVKERLESLSLIKNLHRRHGHIQEVIIQNFRAKAGTAMAGAPEASLEEMLETVALARMVLGPQVNIQAPPNLAPSDPSYSSSGRSSVSGTSAPYLAYLEAGINDYGGISPLTRDYVNPEAPWPRIGWMRGRMSALGYQLRARFPVYPEYFLEKTEFLPETLVKRLRQEADCRGYLGSDSWAGREVAARNSSENGSQLEAQL
ncbi:MAG: 7,8-didemethyl-8-hydroxy-5-deazariboflavin synthase CofG [Acidobacteriota bacterium]